MSDPLLRRMALVPDEWEPCNEAGEPFGWEPIKTRDRATKLHIAAYSLRWKQSIQVTFERIFCKAVREYLREHRA